MERRTYPRIPATLVGFLLGNSHEVVGRTIDLSIGGAKFESELDVHPGKTIVVRLVLPESDAPMVIEEALVRWTGSRQFGVEFLNLDSTERGELEQLIDELDDAEEAGHA